MSSRRAGSSRRDSRKTLATDSPRGKRYVCHVAFNPTPKERTVGKMIQLNVNDVLVVTGQFPELRPPMMKGQNRNSKEMGLFPASCVRPAAGSRKGSSPSLPAPQATDMKRQNPLAMSMAPTQASPSLARKPLKPKVHSGTVRFQRASGVVEPAIKVVKVMHAFEGSSEGELSASKGEVIAVTNEHQESGWSRGRTIEGKTGVFPLNHTVELTTFDPGLLSPVRVTAPSHVGTLRSTSEDREQRKRLVLEIIKTEAYLMDALSQLNEYRVAISNSKYAEHVGVLFANLPLLRRVVSCFNRLLAPLATNYDDKRTMLGPAFIQMAPFFSLYADFGNAFDAAQKRLDALLEKKAFASLLEEVRHSDLRMSDFLIMPVQRVPRYKLLLRDLIKITSEGHPDLANLKLALGLVSALGTNINETIRDQENSAALLGEKKARFDVAPFLMPPRKLSQKIAGVSCEMGGCKGGKKTADVHLIVPDLLIFVFSSTCKPKSELRVEFNHLVWPLSLVQAESEGKSGRKILVHGPQEDITMVFGKKATEQRNAFLKELHAESTKQHVKGHKGSFKGLYETPEGTIYDGEWVAGQMQGHGTQTLTGGTTYTGPFMQGERHGSGGKLSFPDGSILEGTFDHGLPSGSCTIRYANGDAFTGAMFKGVRQGVGQFQTSAFIYKGDFADDQITGTGELKSQSRVYKGGMLRGRFHGPGTLKQKHGPKLKGTFVGGKLQGPDCEITYADGSVYKGAVVAGKRVADMAKLTYKDGSSYIGAFANDEPHGQGKLETKGKQHLVRIYDGQWSAGLFHGKGRALFASGDSYHGDWKNGEMHGSGVYTSANKELVIEGVWAANLLNKSNSLNQRTDIKPVSGGPAMVLKSAEKLNPLLLAPPRPSVPLLLDM